VEAEKPPRRQTADCRVRALPPSRRIERER